MSSCFRETRWPESLLWNSAWFRLAKVIQNLVDRPHEASGICPRSSPVLQSIQIPLDAVLSVVIAKKWSHCRRHNDLVAES